MSIYPFSLQQSKPNKLEYESHTKGLMTRRHQARLTRRIREEFPKQKSHDANDNATPTAGWRIEAERSNLLLRVTVGSQCISPLFWALRMGRSKIASCIENNKAHGTLVCACVVFSHWNGLLLGAVPTRLQRPCSRICLQSGRKQSSKAKRQTSRMKESYCIRGQQALSWLLRTGIGTTTALTTFSGPNTVKN